MHPFRITVPIAALLPCLLLGGALAMPSAHAAAAAAEPPLKQRLCSPCTMPLLPVALPRHGMVLAHGGILSTSSLWYMVDLERGEASRILARLDAAAKQLEVVEQSTRPIPPADLATLKTIAGRIWASPDRLPTRMATDVVWDLWQLDGDDVRRDFGPGGPDGLAKDAEQIMERLVGVPAPVQPARLPF